MTQQFVKGNRIQRQFFLNQQMPHNLGENYVQERAYFWQDLVKKMKQTSHNHEVFAVNIKTLINKFKQIFGLEIEELEYLITSLIHLIFGKQDVRSEQKAVYMRIVNDLLSQLQGYKLPNLKLDFTVFYEFLERFYLTNESRSIQSETGLYGQLTEMNYMLKRLRHYFSDESVVSVYNIFKQKFTPLDANTGFQIMGLFLKTSCQDQQYKHIFQAIVDELVEFFFYRYSDKDNISLYILKDIAKYHPDLEWGKHYERLFYIFFRNFNNLVKNDYQEQAQQEERILETVMPDPISGIKCNLKVIPDFLVHLMPGSENPNFEKYWQYLERILDFIYDLLNPSQDGNDWVGDIFKFLKYFTRGFVRKYNLSERRIQQIMKEKLNPEEQGEDDFDDDIKDEQELELQQDSDYIRFGQEVPQFFKNILQEQQNGKMEEEIDSQTTNNNIKSNKKFRLNDGSMRIHNAQIKELYNNKFLLDVKVRDLVLEKLVSYVKKFVYMEDQGYAQAKMIYQLSQFCPDKILPEFFKYFFLIIEKNEDDMDLTTLKNTLLFIVQPIIQNNASQATKLGTIALVKWLNKSFKFFKLQGFVENLDMVEIYSKILLYIPLNTYSETVKDYINQNPGKDEDDFKNEYNMEERDYIQALQDLEEWNTEFFKILIDQLGHLEFKDQEDNSLLIDVQNIFWNYFSQQSTGNRKKQILILFERLEDRIFQNSLNALNYFLTCFSLLEPEFLIETCITMVKSKLLKKRTNFSESNKYREHFLYFVLENSKFKNDILEYELAISNMESISYYMGLLEHTVAYGNSHLIKYEKDFEILTHLCFFHEEKGVFEKACDLIHTIIISMINFYPKDIYYLSKQQLKNNRNYRHFPLKQPPKMRLEDYQVEWYEPSQQDIEYAHKWVKLTQIQMMEHFEKKFFSSQEFKLYDYNKDYLQLIDKLILINAVDMSELKKELYHCLFLMLAGISSINNKMPWVEEQGKELDPVFTQFKDKFLIKEFEGYRENIFNFIQKFPSLLIQKDLFHEDSLMEMYYYICREAFGETYLTAQVNRVGQQLLGIKALNPPKYRNQFDSRFLFISEHLEYCYEKVDYYFMNYPYLPKQTDQLFGLFFILSFSPDYQFRFFLRIHHKQNNGLDNVFTLMHEKILRVLTDKLDPKNENSYTYKLQKAQESERPEFEKALYSMISEIRRLQKIQSINSILKHYETFDIICQILSFYNGLDKKLYKKQFINNIYKSMCTQYEDSQLSEFLNRGSSLQSPIAQSSEYFEQNKPDLKSVNSQENWEQGQQNYLNLLEKISNNLLDDSIHWKPRVIYGQFACYLLNMFQNVQEAPQIQKLLSAFIQLSIYKENIHLNQLGRAGIHRIINMNKRHNKKVEIKSHIYLNSAQTLNSETQQQKMEEEAQNQERSLDEFLTWHFIKNEDFNKTIKKRYQGSFEEDPNYPKFSDYLIDGKSVFGQQLVNYFYDKEFCTQFLQKVMLDKDMNQVDQEMDMNFDTSQVQSMDMTNTDGNFFHALQISFAFNFDRDRKKDHSLFVTQHTVQLYDVYMRFFKKLFQAMGGQFFEVSKDFIKGLSSEYDKYEKLRLVAFYVCALIKWLQKRPESEWQYYLDYSVEIGQRFVEFTSQEIYRDFMSALMYSFRNNDIRLTSRFVDPILQKASLIKFPGKRLRYYDILKFFVAANGIRTRKWSLQSLEMFMNQKISDKKECEEMVNVITDILVYVLCVPLNTKKLKAENWIKEGYQKCVDDKLIYKYTEITSFEVNQKLVEFFEFLDKKVRDESDEDQTKLYTFFSFKLLENLVVNRYNDIFWNYFKKIFVLLLEKKCDDINQTEILQKMSESEYPAHIFEELLDIVKGFASSSNWQIRKKAMGFMKDILYNQSFIQNKLILPEFFLDALVDDMSDLSWKLITSLSDILKICTQEELKQLFEKYKALGSKKLPRNKKGDNYKQILQQKTQGSYVLMAMVLHNSEEILFFTDEALKIILQNSNISSNVKKITEDFLGKYWTGNKDQLDDRFYTGSQFSLSDDVVDEIANFSNNLTYIA